MTKERPTAAKKDFSDLIETTIQIMTLRGGPTSGNWAHGGRKGKRGGSGKGGGFKRIGVKGGKNGAKKLGRKGIKRSSRQTRVKDERGKGTKENLLKSPKKGKVTAMDKQVSLLEKNHKSLGKVGLNGSNFLASAAKSGKDKLTGKASPEELKAIDELKKAGLATYDGKTFQLSKKGKDVGGALSDARDQVGKIGKFFRSTAGPKRGGDSFGKSAIDGYDELLKHESYMLNLTSPLPGSGKQLNSKDKLSSSQLDNVTKRIDRSMPKVLGSTIAGRSKASDILK